MVLQKLASLQLVDDLIRIPSHSDLAAATAVPTFKTE
jgi:hypothetical protein